MPSTRKALKLYTQYRNSIKLHASLTLLGQKMYVKIVCHLSSLSETVSKVSEVVSFNSSIIGLSQSSIFLIRNQTYYSFFRIFYSNNSDIFHYGVSFYNQSHKHSFPLLDLSVLPSQNEEKICHALIFFKYSLFTPAMFSVKFLAALSLLSISN